MVELLVSWCRVLSILEKNLGTDAVLIEFFLVFDRDCRFEEEALIREL